MNNDTEITKTDEGAMEQLQEGRYLRPPVDIYENTDEILLHADLPGVASGDLTINLENGELVVQGLRTVQPIDAEVEAQRYVYHRTFRIPKSIDETKIDATLKHGVLELHMPKREALKPRQIFVRTD